MVKSDGPVKKEMVILWKWGGTRGNYCRSRRNITTVYNPSADGTQAMNWTMNTVQSSATHNCRRMNRPTPLVLPAVWSYQTEGRPIQHRFTNKIRW